MRQTTRSIHLLLGLALLKDRRLIGNLIEMYKVISSPESIEWVKPLNLRRNVDISRPAVNVRGNSLSMCRESFSSRIRNSFCSWATLRIRLLRVQDSSNLELVAKYDCHFSVP